MIGSRLGSYQITHRLGEGGMGEVYQATDSKLRRKVAIKVLPEAFTEDPEKLARFKREAQLLAQLQHANIASVYGLEESDGVRALVLELVEGPTLDESLASGALAWQEALPIARQIAVALEAAHDKGIIHRDLKPQNIKLTAEGQVKVLDFGLAKAIDSGEGGGSAPNLTLSPTLLDSPTLTAMPGTRLGVILGTAAYMAPEQARGLAVDKRADIWAFGVVLYEMLTGRSLFLAETVPDTLAAVLTRDLDLEALQGSTPPALRRLLRLCLERQPKNRLRDIGDARILLDEVAHQAPHDVAPTAEERSGPSWRRVLPWIAGLAIGLALGALLSPFGPTKPRSEPPRPSTMRMLVATGQSSDPDVSPDGKTLAFTSNRSEETRIWIKDLASGSESALTRDPAWNARFSPDGATLLFTSDGEESRTDLYRIALTTREERLLARNAESGDWSPDGSRVSFLRHRAQANLLGEGYRELVVLELSSGEEKVIFSDENESMSSARWSPDGRHIVVSFIAFQTGGTAHLGLLDVEAGTLKSSALELPGITGLEVRGMTWIDSERLALLVLDGGLRLSSSGRIATYEPGSGFLRSLMPLSTVGQGLDVANDGGLVFGVGSRDQNLRETRRGPDGWSESELLTEGPFSDRQPVYSPDGRWLLFSSDRSGNIDIWRLTRSTGELRRLTDHVAADWDPAVSPDGEHLVFSSNRSGSFQIWIADADGSSPRQVTDLENAQNPTMTPDGQWIVFTLQDAFAAENDGLWKIRPDGSDLTQIASGPYLVPETGPRGRFVATRTTPEDGRRVVSLADGRQLDVSIPFTDRYRWSDEADGLFLWALLSEDEVNTEVEARWVVRYAFDPARGTLGAEEIVLSWEEAGQAETLGVAADGSALAVSSIARSRSQIVRVDHLRGLQTDRIP